MAPSTEDGIIINPLEKANDATYEYYPASLMAIVVDWYANIAPELNERVVYETGDAASRRSNKRRQPATTDVAAPKPLTAWPH